MKSPPPPSKPPQQPPTHLLEINLISAQNLKPPFSLLRNPNLHTFAQVHIGDSSSKLRTRVDRVNSTNPNWNDKFIFRVSKHFLSSETSSFTVEIFAIGVVKNTLLGTVRCLLGNFPTPLPIGLHCCVALQVRRPSGSFHGVLNVGVMAIHGSSGVGCTFSGVSAIGYRDFTGKNRRRSVHLKNHRRNGLGSSSESSGGESEYFSGGGQSSESDSETESGPS